MRILIADDHEVVRRGIKAIFDGHPMWEVCGEAEDGQAAVDKFAELRPNLVVLDLSMPVMGGFQAANRIRLLAPNAKIVILSVHALEMTQAIAALCGVDAVLTKSASRDTILDTVAALFKEPAHV